MQNNQVSALAGIKVLDLSRVLAGPWATQMLADFGADVVKIEPPLKGDDTRGWGPPFIQSEQSSDAAYFHTANRNKQSVAIDFSKAEGQALIRRLAAESDVLVENFKVGGLAKYGLDYASLQALNPRLIYCSITGFGQSGPLASQPGYDFMIQAMGGLMSITGEPNGAPMKVGVALADILTGLYACNAIQAALLYRHATGLGQHIDLALLDVQIASLANQAMNYLVSGESPTRLGNAHPNIVPYQSFATADGHIILAIGNDQQFARFCTLPGCESLLQQPEFSTNAQRVKYRDQLVPLLAQILLTQPSDWWLTQLEAQSVPCGPINTLAGAFANPQVQHRQMQRQFTGQNGQAQPFVGNPIQFSQSPVQYNSPPPALGQHTEFVLQQRLGLSEQDIAHLAKLGVINPQIQD
ncbi:CoA transferase [Bowmanella sp. Y26]|uniref:CaiB/BaiF CoA transferase family protein n=1 Tax=Bowmanella yangjiangensis TaxID=2811230 RepID=UPI001BDD1F59|nr:CaiB/BaiF CoA-transferase family protein [Bowmanella yangjiangensis]MBT1062928.1 CoA transferase [Bowmanella yangjiangensis]